MSLLNQRIKNIQSMEYTIEEKVTATAFAIAFDNAEESRRRFVEKLNKENHIVLEG